MNDSETIIPATPTAPSTTATVKAISDLSETAKLAEQTVADYKAKGLAGLSTHAAQLISQAQQDFRDVTDAIPEIKAGWKSSEFLGIAGWAAVNAGLAFFGKPPLPEAVNTAVAALLGVYAVVRGLVKSSAVKSAAVATVTAQAHAATVIAAASK